MQEGSPPGGSESCCKGFRWAEGGLGFGGNETPTVSPEECNLYPNIL